MKEKFNAEETVYNLRVRFFFHLLLHVKFSLVKRSIYFLLAGLGLFGMPIECDNSKIGMNELMMRMRYRLHNNYVLTVGISAILNDAV